MALGSQLNLVSHAKTEKKGEREKKKEHERELGVYV